MCRHFSSIYPRKFYWCQIITRLVKKKKNTTVIHNVQKLLLLLFCLLGVGGCIFHSPIAGFSFLIFEVSRSHTTTRHSRQDSSGRVINLSQRPLPDNTQHSQQTNIQASGGIRTHNLSRRAAVDLRLRPRGYWDRKCVGVVSCKTEQF